MKLLCFVKISILFVVFTFQALYASSLERKSAMVYYGDDISYSQVGIHDYIILQPEHVDTASHGFKLYKKNIYAYVSVGEVEKELSYYSEVNPEWIIGKNDIWNAAVVDVGSKAYRHFFFEKVIGPLLKKGFKNFFFDTLDSYTLAVKEKKDVERMRLGLISLIKEFHSRYPECKLIINRGFELIDDVHGCIEAVLFESLFHGLSGKELKYKNVSEADRKWLLAQVKKIQGYHIPVIAVDYLPIKEEKKIQKAIASIEELGLIPYVADRYLQRFGKSSKIAVRREVLLLYDDTEFDGTPGDDKMYSTSFLYLAMSLEYMGYIPVIKPISEWKLRPPDVDRYAGATVWINGTYAVKYPKKFEAKMAGLYNSGIKLLMLESIEAEKHKKLFDMFKISVEPLAIKPGYQNRGRLIYDNSRMGFEIEPFIPSGESLFMPDNAKPLCSVKYARGTSVLAAITPWGGYAFEGAVMAEINQENLWIANPFKLLRESLRLPLLPAPDVTTENGRRLLFVHIDGDGIMNRAEWNPELFSGQVLYDEIFTKYHIPLSVSIIEGETAAYGLYPKLSPSLEKIARRIFALENVEAATHTYTHPFYWGKIVDGHLDPKYRLNVKNYDFSLDRELLGSLRYINTRLEPEGRSTNMVFWSGDCMPTETTLSYVYKNNILQINGGDTMATNTSPWLSLISPMGIKRGNYYQIFTAAQNENVYTNNWLGPFWGFKKVIQTFKLTDAPRRFKPIDIYFHLYSGSKKASLRALHTVFDWAMVQEVMPIYTSEYILKAMDFYEVSMAKDGNEWLAAGMHSLKTLRLPESGFIDFDLSVGVAGIKKHSSGNYLHLDSGSTHRFSIAGKQKRQNYLVDSNGKLLSHKRSAKEVFMRFHANIPLEFNYQLADNCRLDAVPQADERTVSSGRVSLKYHTERDANVTVRCR